jgi:uncharacterized protein YbaR (Trm112 family)
MKQFSIVLLVAACCGLAGWTVYQQTKTTPVEISVTEETTDEITLLNTATGVVTRVDWVPTPAIDPQTGKATLVQALYCEKCRKWYPAPPQAMAERLPGGPVCYYDKTRLTAAGPLTPTPSPGG